MFVFPSVDCQWLHLMAELCWRPLQTVHVDERFVILILHQSTLTALLAPSKRETFSMSFQAGLILGLTKTLKAILVILTISAINVSKQSIRLGFGFMWQVGWTFALHVIKKARLGFWWSSLSLPLVVSNKWIHERGQEWRRPCGLKETEW